MDIVVLNDGAKTVIQNNFQDSLRGLCPYLGGVMVTGKNISLCKIMAASRTFLLYSYRFFFPQSPKFTVIYTSRRSLQSNQNSLQTKNRYLGCVHPSKQVPQNPKNPSFYNSRRSLQSTQNAHQTKNQDVGSVHQANVIDILEERGLIESITSENLRSTCSNPNFSPLKVYCGFDPTAESLHLGNLIGIIVLSWFQRCRHKTVALIGGATGRIGDPSGKSLERPELDVETVEKNSKGIENVISGILGRRDKNTIFNVGSDKNMNMEVGFGDSFVILNNFDWWKNLNLLDFLRDYGRYMRVGEMISKESVKRRLNSEEGISFTEFTYQLLQAYDFLHMFKYMGVNVQIGGSDQWGNITAGTELIRKKLQVEGAYYGLTFPLLLKSDGTKFGKSEEGAVWLSSSMLSPYKFYQYFFSVPDVDVVRFLKILTFLSLEVIEELEKGMKMPGYVPNSVQRRLAEEVTRFVHGEEALLEALKATQALRPGAETQLDWKTIEGVAEDVPSCSLAYDQVLNSSLVDLSVSTGLLGSKSAVRRMLKQGGLYLNNRRVDSEEKMIEVGDIVDGKIKQLNFMDRTVWTDKPLLYDEKIFYCMTTKSTLLTFPMQGT
ncbi:tyrosyl-tRNA synthetase, class Ib, bacterial/mitochondrial isoform X2 [Tasmannia lanceolata]|uniref:tyrosyl-tRNA synthetase, class Ib, bacterial/mitochondrial isoform X2 n=1 Tax=Tasmannia lanceolata TaxID=3420 RepID=UPI00406364DB